MKAYSKISLQKCQLRHQEMFVQLDWGGWGKEEILLFLEQINASLSAMQSQSSNEEKCNE